MARPAGNIKLGSVALFPGESAILEVDGEKRGREVALFFVPKWEEKPSRVVRCTSFAKTKIQLENSLTRRLKIQANARSFDCG